VFLDRCFWHGCPDHYRPSNINESFWSAKITENEERDQDTDPEVEGEGLDRDLNLGTRRPGDRRGGHCISSAVGPSARPLPTPSILGFGCSIAQPGAYGLVGTSLNEGVMVVCGQLKAEHCAAAAAQYWDRYERALCVTCSFVQKEGC
jgi:hypothetical protein